MCKTKNILFILVALWLCMACWMAPAFAASIQKPVIYSYYWPIDKGQKDLLNWTMETPSIVDIPPQSVQKWLDAEAYWAKKGKIILYRVHPFRGINTEHEMYKLFAKNMEKATGIAIDEIPTKMTIKQGKMFVNVLKRVRRDYPDRIIAVWSTRFWNSEKSFVLVAIRDYADMFIPQIYIAQRAAQKHGFGIFKRTLESVEAFAPGITPKTIAGLGVHSAMADNPSENFGDHLSAQIRFLRTDPFFNDIMGIAIYAPVYLSVEDQKRIDSELKKYFSR